MRKVTLPPFFSRIVHIIHLDLFINKKLTMSTVFINDVLINLNARIIPTLFTFAFFSCRVC